MYRGTNKIVMWITISLLNHTSQSHSVRRSFQINLMGCLNINELSTPQKSSLHYIALENIVPNGIAVFTFTNKAILDSLCSFRILCDIHFDHWTWGSPYKTNLLVAGANCSSPSIKNVNRGFVWVFVFIIEQFDILENIHIFILEIFLFFIFVCLVCNLSDECIDLPSKTTYNLLCLTASCVPVCHSCRFSLLCFHTTYSVWTWCKTP